MTTDYQTLLTLIQNKESLKNFFSIQRDYRTLFNDLRHDPEISSDNIITVAQELDNHMPTLNWIDIGLLHKEIHTKITDISTETYQYNWCMLVDNVRKTFSTENKGKFIHLGLSQKNHLFAYYASIDDDYLMDLKPGDTRTNNSDYYVYPSISHELDRFKKQFEFLDSEEHAHYLNWMTEKILPAFCPKDQYYYLYSYLAMVCLKIKDIHMDDMFRVLGLVETSTDNSSSTLFKSLVEQVERKIGFTKWDNDSRMEFIKMVNNSSFQDFAPFYHKKTTLDSADKNLVIMQARKLEQELPLKEITNKKVKL